MLRYNVAACNAEGSASVKKFPGLKVIVILLFPLFLAACAIDRPPTGGPPDTTPLGVVASTPEPGSVNTSPETIHLDFSHYVGRQELIRSLHFTPSLNNYEVEMHGKQAVIRIFSSLQPNRTYTLTLPTNLKALYGNHRLGKSWALAFSTGPVIDTGSVAGQAWTPRMTPAADVTVMAVPASGKREGMNKQAPEYFTQTDPSGKFRFDHLAPGSYRIVAFADRNGKLHYDPKSESLAIAFAKTSDGKRAVNLRLSAAHSHPALLSCHTINDREIEISFTRPIPVGSFEPSLFSIENVSSGKLLPILGYFSLSRSDEAASWRLLTGVMNKEAWYRLRFLGKEASPELTFPGNGRKERYPALSVIIDPVDGSESVVPELLRPGATPAVELRFNLPVAASSLTSGAITLDLIEPIGTSTVPCTMAKIDSRTYAVRPNGGFLLGRSYTLRVYMIRLKSLIGGMAPGKQVVTSNFEITEKYMYGEINGKGKATGKRVVVEAHLQNTPFVKRLQLRPSATGEFSFSFTEMPAGRYVLTAFEPSVPSAQWNAGSIKPFAPADPFSTLTVGVRAGWSTDDVRLDAPSSKDKSTPRTNNPENH